MAVQVSTKKFTVYDFHRMGEAGIFSEDDRVELLEGEIIEMTPIGSRHAACVARLDRRLNSQLGNTAVIWIQNPIRLNDQSEPQPDIVLLKTRTDFYEKAHPTPDDVLLVIEVADTTVEFDRETKLPLYAKAGIPEVWIVDLTQRRVETYRQPSPRGYESMSQLTDVEQVAPQAFPTLKISLQEIFG